MYLFVRLKNLLFAPQQEWNVIKAEVISNFQIYLKYVLWIALLPSVGYLLSFLRYGSVLINLRAAIINYAIVLISIDLSAYAIYLLAPSFNSVKDLNLSLKLAAFSMASLLVAGLLVFIPVLGAFVWIVGAAYGAYLLYLGLPVLLKTPEDKRASYLVTAFVIMLGSYILLAVIASLIFEVGLLKLAFGSLVV